MICSSPYKFEAPWDRFEFATHVMNTGAKLVVVSMAWITHEDQRTFIQKPDEPDMDTLTYWISRLEPIIRTESDEEVIVIFANRTGVEEDATYAGTSAIVGVQSGEVRVYGILGRGEKRLLVVDTEDQPFAKLVYCPEAKTSKNAVPETSKPVDRETPRETNGGGPNSRTTSEPVPSKLRQAGAETSIRAHVPAPENRSSPPKRDDLSVKIYEKNQLDKQYGKPGVHTPSGPSPTPYNIRPLFPNQPAGFDAQTHNDADLLAYYNYKGPMTGGDEPLLIDPEATARRFGLVRNVSPSQGSESPRSDYSISSSKMYWNPREQSEVKPTPRPRLGNSEQMISDFNSMTFDESKRHSARSDVAVWNNEPGHPRGAISFPTASQEPKLRSTLHTTERNRSLDQNGSRYVNRSRHGPPGMSKSRNDSRSERKDRSVPSILPMPDMVAACERFEEFAQLAETAQGRFDSMRESSKSVGPVPLEKDSRTANPSRQRSVRPPSRSKVKRKPSKGSMSVPFAIDSGPARGTNRSNANLNMHERSMSTSAIDPPILRPASRSRINSEMKRGRGADINAPIPDNAVLGSRIHSVLSASQEHRAMSRGRTQSARPLDTHSADPMRSRNTRRDAHKRHESAQDAVDLAQYRMIEEYPSKKCPVHGSRSRSRAGHRSSSRQKSSGTPRMRQQAFQQGRENQTTTQTPPSTGNRRVPESVRVPFKLTTDLAKPSRGTESLAFQGQHRPSGSVSAVPSSASTLSPGQDPQTPVAMILVSDNGGQQPHPQVPWLSGVEGVGRDTEVNLVKPLSVGY